MESNRHFEFPTIDTVLAVAVIGSFAVLTLFVVCSPDLLNVLA